MQQFLKGGALLVAGILISSPVFAARISANTNVNSPALASNANPHAKANNALSTADGLLSDSKNVVARMKQNPQLAKDMAMAKGILIFPNFGRGAFIIGGRGGTGVMLDKVNIHWSDPVFFDMGGGSIGPQIGGSGGPVAFLLMSDQAVQRFKSGNNFSINGGAGFTIANFSTNTQVSSGKGADVIFWSGTGGAYVGASVSLSDIGLDHHLNQAFYGMPVQPQAILNGKVAVNKPAAEQLKRELPA